MMAQNFVHRHMTAKITITSGFKKHSPSDSDKTPITVLLSSLPHDSQMMVLTQQRPHPYRIGDMLVSPWHTLLTKRTRKLFYNKKNMVSLIFFKNNQSGSPKPLSFSVVKQHPTKLP